MQGESSETSHQRSYRIDPLKPFHVANRSNLYTASLKQPSHHVHQHFSLAQISHGGPPVRGAARALNNRSDSLFAGERRRSDFRTPAIMWLLGLSIPGLKAEKLINTPATAHCSEHALDPRQTQRRLPIIPPSP